MSEANKIIYEDGTWTIDLRARNNHHEGEPDVRVWVWKRNNEVAKYTDKFRGYGHYTDHEELIPSEISGAARLAWQMLKDNVGSDADITEDLKTALADFVAKAAEEGTGEESAE